MDRNYILGLLVISFMLINVVAFLDEGIRTFDYLKYLGDWIALTIYTALFSVLPVIIFLLSKEKKEKRFLYALYGYTPVLLLIFLML